MRASASSGASTLAWLTYLPVSLVFGAVTRADGVYVAGRLLVGIVAGLCVLLVRTTDRQSQAERPRALSSAY